MSLKLISGLLAATFVLVACAKEEEMVMEKVMEPVMEEETMSKL